MLVHVFVVSHMIIEIFLNSCVLSECQCTGSLFMLSRRLLSCICGSLCASQFVRFVRCVSVARFVQ